MWGQSCTWLRREIEKIEVHGLRLAEIISITGLYNVTSSGKLMYRTSKTNALYNVVKSTCNCCLSGSALCRCLLILVDTRPPSFCCLSFCVCICVVLPLIYVFQRKVPESLSFCFRYKWCQSLHVDIGLTVQLALARTSSTVSHSHTSYWSGLSYLEHSSCK